MNADAASRYVIAPPPVPALPVKGSDGLFPVHRVYCVGRNYAAHAVEMGHDPNRDAAFLLPEEPRQSQPHRRIPLPAGIERRPPRNRAGRGLEERRSRHPGRRRRRLHLWLRGRPRHDPPRPPGEGEGIGRPWEVAKAFEASAPCSPLVPASTTGRLDSGAIWLDVNGDRRQTGDLNQMIWKVPEIIGHLSGLFTLAPGDLIFTGTPSGVAAVRRGDRLHGHIDGVGDLQVKVV